MMQQPMQQPAQQLQRPAEGAQGAQPQAKPAAAVPKDKAADASQKNVKPQAQVQTQQPTPAPEGSAAPSSVQMLSLDATMGQKMKRLPQFAQQVAPGHVVVQRTMQAAN